MCVDTVSHEVKGSIWGNERDASFTFKLVEANTLVELDVLHFDELSARGLALLFEEFFVVETKLQLWHSC